MPGRVLSVGRVRRLQPGLLPVPAPQYLRIGQSPRGSPAVRTDIRQQRDQGVCPTALGPRLLGAGGAVRELVPARGLLPTAYGSSWCRIPRMPTGGVRLAPDEDLAAKLGRRPVL